MDLYQVYAYFIPCILPFFRISTILFTMPVIGTTFVPKKIKILTALSLTYCLADQLQGVPIPNDMRFYLYVLQECMLGCVLGFIAQIFFQIAVTAGEMVAFQSSLSFATLLDNNTHSGIPAISQLYQVFFFLLYFSLNGHIFLFEVFKDSLSVFPPGTYWFHVSLLTSIFDWAPWIFKGGLLSVLPIILILLLLNLSVGVLAKAVPQIQVINIGFPFYISALFLLLFISIGNYAVFFDDLSLILKEKYAFVKDYR